MHDGVGGECRDYHTRVKWLRLKNCSVNNCASLKQPTPGVSHVFSHIVWVTLVDGCVHPVVPLGCVLWTELLCTSSGVGGKSWQSRLCRGLCALLVASVTFLDASLPVLRASLARRPLRHECRSARSKCLESACNPGSFTTVLCHCRWLKSRSTASNRANSRYTSSMYNNTSN